VQGVSRDGTQMVLVHALALLPPQLLRYISPFGPLHVHLDATFDPASISAFHPAVQRSLCNLSVAITGYHITPRHEDMPHMKNPTGWLLRSLIYRICSKSPAESPRRRRFAHEPPRSGPLPSAACVTRLVAVMPPLFFTLWDDGGSFVRRAQT